MKKRPIFNYAVESNLGWNAVLASNPFLIRAWMLSWFRVYDSDGNLVREG